MSSWDVGLTMDRGPEAVEGDSQAGDVTWVISPSQTLVCHIEINISCQTNMVQSIRVSKAQFETQALGISLHVTG